MILRDTSGRGDWYIRASAQSSRLGEVEAVFLYVNRCRSNHDWLVVSNILLCSSLLGEMIQFDEHMFQMGWNQLIRSCFFFKDLLWLAWWWFHIMFLNVEDFSLKIRSNSITVFLSMGWKGLENMGVVCNFHKPTNLSIKTTPGATTTTTTAT